MNIFQRDYSSESLCDLSRDVEEAVDPAYNSLVETIPQDENGFHQGTFKVTIEWVPDE